MQSILEVFHQIDTDVSTVILLRLGKISNQCQPIFVLRYQTNTMFSCNLLKNKSKLRQSEHFKHVSFSTNCTLLQCKHFKSKLDIVINIKEIC